MQEEKRIKLLTEKRETGTGGRVAITYTEIATLWGRVITKTHAPQVKGDKTIFPVSLIVRTAFNAVYRQANHIEVDGKRYKIIYQHGKHTVDGSFCEFTAKVSE